MIEIIVLIPLLDNEQKNVGSIDLCTLLFEEYVYFPNWGRQFHLEDTSELVHTLTNLTHNYCACMLYILPIMLLLHQVGYFKDGIVLMVVSATFH